MPNFEVVDARIASALNRINHNSHLQKKNQSGGDKKHKNRTVSLRGRQIAYLNHEQFRVTGANFFVDDCADEFAIAFRNDDVQKFDSRIGRNFL